MLRALCALFIRKKPRLLVHWHRDVITKGFLGKILRALESALLRRTDCTGTASPMHADASKALAPFRSKIAVIPYGVPEAKHAEADSVRPSLIEKRIHGKQVILTAGRLVPYKGFGVLIDAAKHLSKDSMLVIVDGGPLQLGLHQLIELAGAKDRVMPAGWLSNVCFACAF
jgi:glycosyltransferase involved in cell wall biosynthesis